jgi:hypothetical protein
VTSLQKTADDYGYGPPFGQSRLLPIDALHAQADALNQELRLHEALRMSQMIENLGGPGSERSRYLRAVMTNPYRLSPLLPFMGAPSMHPGTAFGSVYSSPNAMDLQAGQPDPEQTALEVGITHTASARIAQEMGRTMAKVAHEYEQQGYEQYPQEEQQYASPPQYVRALSSPSHLQLAKHHAAEAASALGHGLGESAVATGHGVRALLGGLGRVVPGFMSQEPQPGMRWGTGMPPAPVSNEYGQPIY